MKERLEDDIATQDRSDESIEEQYATVRATLAKERERFRERKSMCSAMTAELLAEMETLKGSASRANELLGETREALAKRRARASPDGSREEHRRIRYQFDVGRNDDRALARSNGALEALREQRALTRLAGVLASNLDYESTLTQIVESIAKDLGDFAVLYVSDTENVAHRVRAASRDPSTDWFNRFVLELRGNAAPNHPVSRVIATKQSLVLGATPAVMSSLAHSRAHEMALSTLRLQSVMAVPLVIGERCLGVLLLKSASRVYGSADLRLAEEIGQRTALLIENARIHENARQAIRARDEMLAVVAHDLRNPLSTILLQASVLTIDGERSQGRVQEVAAVIQDAANLMKRLIEDLLDVARIESGRMSLRRSRISVGSTFAEFVRLEQPIMSSVSIDLRVDLPADLSDIFADHDRLLQVLENLVGNATRYTPRGGRITIGAMESDADVLFWVSDTGPGIDVAELSELLDPCAAVRRIERPGTGLGLTIVKGIVEAHGGHVWVESALGEGTFFFTLPASR